MIFNDQREMNMSEEEKIPEEEKMSETSKVAFAIIGVFVIGFALVAVSKREPSTEQKEGAAMVRNYAALQEMATDKCPKAIKEATNEQVYFPSETESDKESFITMKWVGENVKNNGFKTASCTVRTLLGGISELKIDDKVLISKNVNP
jgi:hypothetical protein